MNVVDWQAIKPWIVEASVVAHMIITFWLLVRILQQQRNHGVAIAWVAILFAMPVVGVIAYFLFGEVNIGRQYRQRSMLAQQILSEFARAQQIDFQKTAVNLSKPAEQISQIGFLKTGIGVYDNHTVTLLTEAEVIFASLLADIEAARHTILLEFYIVYPKGRVLAIFAALMRAVERGVECHLLADSVGSHRFFKSHWVKQLRDAGIHIHESFPVGLFKTLVKRIDIRNHRKLAVFDTQYGYTGSFNLIDPDYFKQDAKVGKWVDVMIRIENDDPVSVVKAMSLVVTTDISAETRTNLSSLERYINNFTKRLYISRGSFGKLGYRRGAMAQDDRLAGATDNTPLSVILPIQRDNPHAFLSISQVAAQLIPSAPELTGHVIYETLVCAIFAARQRVVITTPYFVPDDALLLALTTAAKRGVQVIINVPKKVDSVLVHYASRAYYAPLLKAGVQIALFTRGLLHAKIVSIDENYCLFGTVNMDMRSFYLNMEVSVAIYNRQMQQQLLLCQQDFIQQSEFLDAQVWQQRHFLPTFLDNGIRLFSPLL